MRVSDVLIFASGRDIMKTRLLLLFLTGILLLLRGTKGSLTLTLNGYDIIPTNGSGRILITDIGTSNVDALHCQSTGSTTTGTSDWYYNPTSLSLDPSDRIIVPDELERGWYRNRDVEKGVVRLFREKETDSPLEGVFTCEVAEDPSSPISLGIYYAINVDVVIEVLSARMGTFSVTCTARGGAVLISSLTGPGGVYHELEPVGTPQMRGDDAYSITTRTLSGGNDGDTYQCIATNGVSTPDPSDSETLRVASLPVIELAGQISANTVRVEWSQPSGGATVTGYVVHYSDGTTDRMKSVAASSTSTDISSLSSGRTYTISVEATSSQLSGESDSVDIFMTNADLGDSADADLDNSTNADLDDSTSSSGNSNIFEEVPLIVGVALVALFVAIIVIAGIAIAAVMIARKRTHQCDMPVKVPRPACSVPERMYATAPALQSNMAYGYIGSQPNVAYDFSPGSAALAKTLPLQQEPIYDLPN